jgi:thiamine pyrophosphate-dependent acetolactate synthase large subunit-like protein
MTRVADMQRQPMVPGQIFTVVSDFFPPEAVAAIDGGNTCMWAAHYLRVRSQRSMLWTSNAGHLGTGLPFAIGAKIAAPERTVYCVTGDSAFRFNMQELATAARYQLPIVTVVAVDGAYGMEKSRAGARPGARRRLSGASTRPPVRPGDRHGLSANTSIGRPTSPGAGARASQEAGGDPRRGRSGGEHRPAWGWPCGNAARAAK